MLCSVIRRASDNWRVLVSIDSVITEAFLAARGGMLICSNAVISNR